MEAPTSIKYFRANSKAALVCVEQRHDHWFWIQRYEDGSQRAGAERFSTWKEAALNGDADLSEELLPGENGIRHEVFEQAAAEKPRSEPREGLHSAFQTEASDAEKAPPLSTEGGASEAKKGVFSGDSVSLPGSAAENAKTIQAVSPEGAPAFPKAAPRAIRVMVVGACLLIVAAAVVAAYFEGWTGALIVLALGLLFLLVNPNLGAAMERAKEREPLAKHPKDAEKPRH